MIFKIVARILLLQIFADLAKSKSCQTLEQEFCCVTRHLENCGPKCYAYAAKWCPRLLQSKSEKPFQKTQFQTWTEWTDFSSFEPQQRFQPDFSDNNIPSGFRDSRDQNTVSDNFGRRDQQNAVSIDEQNCGRAPNWRSCISRRNSNGIFTDCCRRYNVPRGCDHLCQYGPGAQPTKYNDYVVWDDTFRNNRECLNYASLIIYCASQNRDNAPCCEDQGVRKLQNGQRCVRFCDPRKHGGLGTLIRGDLECLANWNVLMQCHEAGL